MPSSAAITRPLARLVGVGKDYAVIASKGGRLRTVLDLILGRAMRDRYRAVQSIDLCIQPGESWGIIGENGAGKSTLLKIIAGVVKPSAGSIEVNGRITALLELGAGFHPEYSGRENVYLASALMGCDRAETARHFDEILAFADIGEHIDQPVKTYSSGMVVRLGFAVATALKPDLLVTDEVLAVGDESFQKKCLRWMESYRAGGGALLLCSHSMYHIQTLCDRAIWIHHGQCRMVGDAYSVTQSYLAYHEQKNQQTHLDRPSHAYQSSYPCMQTLTAESVDGKQVSEVRIGDDVVLSGTYRAPDDQPTVVMAGIARVDGTPVFGTFSNAAGFITNRIAPHLFGFRFHVKKCSLLPGKYRFKGHTLDAHGLRLFDTLETEVTVVGKTSDHGLVRLEHSWLSARPLEPQTNDS